MAEVRITKAMRFAELRELVLVAVGEDFIGGDDANDMIAFLDHEIDLLSRKRTTTGTKTPAQVLNDGVKSDIGVVLDGTILRATEVATVVGISVQKATALLRQMVTEGTVRRDEDKKVVTFTLA